MQSSIHDEQKTGIKIIAILAVIWAVLKIWTGISFIDEANLVSYLSTNGSYAIWDYEHTIGAVLQPLGISFSEAISMQLFGSIYLAVAITSIGLGFLYLVLACECYKAVRSRASTSWAWKGGLIISLTNFGLIIFMLTIGSLGRVALGQEPFLQFEIISGYLLHFGVASTFLFLLYSPSVKKHLHRQTGN